MGTQPAMEQPFVYLIGIDFQGNNADDNFRLFKIGSATQYFLGVEGKFESLGSFLGRISDHDTFERNKQRIAKIVDALRLGGFVVTKDNAVCGDIYWCVPYQTIEKAKDAEGKLRVAIGGYLEYNSKTKKFWYPGTDANRNSLLGLTEWFAASATKLEQLKRLNTQEAIEDYTKTHQELNIKERIPFLTERDELAAIIATKDQEIATLSATNDVDAISVSLKTLMKNWVFMNGLAFIGGC